MELNVLVRVQSTRFMNVQGPRSISAPLKLSDGTEEAPLTNWISHHYNSRLEQDSRNLYKPILVEVCLAVSFVQNFILLEIFYCRPVVKSN